MFELWVRYPKTWIPEWRWHVIGAESVEDAMQGFEWDVNVREFRVICHPKDRPRELG